MAYNWLMMTSSAEVWIQLPTRKKKPKAEQETAQPTAARFKKNKPKAEQETAQPTAVWFKKPKAEQETFGLRLHDLTSREIHVGHCGIYRN